MPRELSPAERAALDNGALDEAELANLTGVPALWGEAGYSVAERIGVRPTLDVDGISSGFTGQGQKTVIPARARAKISMRLVPDQDAPANAELVVRHIRQLCPPTITLSIEILCVDNAAMVDMIRSVGQGF